MENKKNIGKKTLVLMMVLMLLIGGVVGGTLAFLIDETAPVVNTFTVGNVALTLDEATVNQYGELLDNNSVVTNNVQDSPRTAANTYKLIPGHSYYKDPTVHVKAGSEPCYIFVKVTNGIEDIEADNGEHAAISAQMAATHWVLVDGTTDVYALENKIIASESMDADIMLFNGFAIADDADVSGYQGKNITIIAYAVQADGFDDYQAAWDATFGK